MACGDDEFGHETLMELGVNRYIEPHPFIPVQAVYIPEDTPGTSGDTPAHSTEIEK